MTLEIPVSDSAYGFVTCRIIRRVADSAADADDKPDVLPAEGSVRFTPVKAQDRSINYSALLSREVIELPLDAQGRMLRHAGAEEPGAWLTVGEWNVTFHLKAGSFDPIRVLVEERHTKDAPLDLAYAVPYTPPVGSVVQTLVVPSDVPDGNVLVKTGDSLTALPLSALKGDPGDPGRTPEVSLVGSVLTVDGVSSDLRGAKGDDGNPGAPGAVATATDYLLVGPGRPDVPATTGGIITGKEPIGCEYRSTDGAAVGAWVWRKRPAGWEVTDMSTGARRLTVDGFTGTPVLSREGNVVTLMLSDVSYPGTGKTPLVIPDGFRPLRINGAFYPLVNSTGKDSGALQVYSADGTVYWWGTGVVRANATWSTPDTAPSTLPGTPA